MSGFAAAAGIADGTSVFERSDAFEDVNAMDDIEATGGTVSVDATGLTGSTPCWTDAGEIPSVISMYAGDKEETGT